MRTHAIPTTPKLTTHECQALAAELHEVRQALASGELESLDPKRRERFRHALGLVLSRLEQEPAN